MNLALLRKCLLETRLLFGATALLVFAFCLVRVFIVASLEMSDFAGIVERLWDKWEKFAPVPLSHLLSYPGRIALAFDEPIVVFGISIFAIARGSDVVSGELNRGTLELLLAQPITRRQVLATQSIVTLACLVLLSLSTWGGTWCGIQLATVKENVPPPQLKLPWLPSIPLPVQTNRNARTADARESRSAGLLARCGQFVLSGSGGRGLQCARQRPATGIAGGRLASWRRSTS